MVRKSRVISVKYETGCYRHFRIPSGVTLENLAKMILLSFNFENDHAHAFFMDDVCWSPRDSYYMDLGEDESEPVRHTCDYKLDVLQVGQSFKFVFDFGEEWVFQCKFLREMEDCDAVEVLRAEGKTPVQYEDWEE